MTKIIVFSGRKQAGKTTAANGLFGEAMRSITYPDGHPIFPYFRFHRTGKLIVPTYKEPPMICDEAGDWIPSPDGSSEGLFDPFSNEPAVVNFLKEDVWPFIRCYNFADELKEFVIRVFNIPREHVYGSDDDKNQKTNIAWGSLPVPPTIYRYPDKLEKHKKKTGNVTVRELLQWFGTKVCRAMHGSCWVEATLRKIEEDKPQIAIIADARFPDEVELVKKAGGKIIRLSRIMHPDDRDESEVALDKYTRFDAVIDNLNMNIEEQHQAIMLKLNEWGFFETEG